MDEETYLKELENSAVETAAGFLMTKDGSGCISHTLFLAGIMASVELIGENMTEDEIATAKSLAEKVLERKDEFLPEPMSFWPQMSQQPYDLEPVGIGGDAEN